MARSHAVGHRRGLVAGVRLRAGLGRGLGLELAVLGALRGQAAALVRGFGDPDDDADDHQDDGGGAGDYDH